MSIDDEELYNREFDTAAADKYSPWLPTLPLKTQIGGQHYKKLKIQPVEYVHANGIGYFEGTAIKYLSRWKDKGGIEDLQKAIHFIQLLIELETK